MSLTLTISDKQDGTGATATIAGSQPGSVNTFFTIDVRLVVQNQGLTNWVQQAQLVGDGSVTLPLFAPGYYWCYVSSAVPNQPASISPLAFFPCTISGTSPFQQIRLAVQARIQMLNLPGFQAPAQGITPDRVYLQSAPTAKNIMYPCVLIASEDEQEGFEGGTNLRDDIVYPLRVFIVDRADITYEKMLPTYLQWRETIMSAFRFGRLGQVPTVWKCVPQPLLVINEGVLEKYQNVVSGMVLRFYSREARG